MANFVLDSTTKSITAVMSSAAATTNPDFTAAFADNDGVAFVEKSSDGVLNGTSPVTLVAAPTAGVRRVIKTITIQNRDTAPVTIAVNFDNNSNLRKIANITLQVNDTWTTDGTFDEDGNLKSTLGIVDLETKVFNILPIPNGGTGISEYGNSEEVLTSQGNGQPAKWGIVPISAGRAIAISLIFG
jgi:hypothetical protein